MSSQERRQHPRRPRRAGSGADGRTGRARRQRGLHGRAHPGTGRAGMAAGPRDSRRSSLPAREGGHRRLRLSLCPWQLAHGTDGPRRRNRSRHQRPALPGRDTAPHEAGSACRRRPFPGLGVHTARRARDRLRSPRRRDSRADRTQHLRARPLPRSQPPRADAAVRAHHRPHAGRSGPDPRRDESTRRGDSPRRVRRPRANRWSRGSGKRRALRLGSPPRRP